MTNTKEEVERRFVYLLVKRIFDIIVGALGVLLLMPICIGVKIVYLCSGDFYTIFHHQERIGRGGRIFKLYKFRTMVPHAGEMLKDLLEDSELAKEYSVNHKLENDPRITKAGGIIRRYSIDELPQLLNILLGQMSLIGNRPYLVREKPQMGSYYDDIVATKPGLTGYWQTSGRSDLSFKQRLKLEAYYSKHCSLALDAKIFSSTFKVVFKGRGAH